MVQLVYVFEVMTFSRIIINKRSFSLRETGCKGEGGRNERYSGFLVAGQIRTRKAIDYGEDQILTERDMEFWGLVINYRGGGLVEKREGQIFLCMKKGGGRNFCAI